MNDRGEIYLYIIHISEIDIYSEVNLFFKSCAYTFSKLFFIFFNQEAIYFLVVYAHV